MLLIIVVLLGLSPVLKTLTEDTSSDTIWLFTTVLFGMNAMFHDYSMHTNGSDCRSSGNMSLNAAISASVLLASRLDNAYDVFGLVLFAIVWFALYPHFRRVLRFTMPGLFRSLTVVSSLICVVMVGGFPLLLRSCMHC